MKKTAVAITFLFGISLCFSAALFAADVDKAAKELSSNIAKEAGLTESEQESINNPVKEMLAQGADKDDIRKAVSGMAKKGVRDGDLKNSVESMKDLVNSGESPKEAGNIVSQAAHNALAEGLKGTALADKVHAAIKEMQAEKREKQETRLEGKQKESQEHGSSMAHEGMGSGRGSAGMRGGRGR